jgi:hypothetical protein
MHLYLYTLVLPQHKLLQLLKLACDIQGHPVWVQEAAHHHADDGQVLQGITRLLTCSLGL